jgi:hypothetical protein
MKLRELQLRLARLATLKESAEPLVSCYLNAGAGALAFEEQARGLRAEAPEAWRAPLEEALNQIRAFVLADPPNKHEGLAVFARAGQEPLFLGLRLRAPLPTRVVSDWRPHVYPLVEIRDNYDHFVVMHATDSRVKILEVDLGAAVEVTLKTRPALRRREGREWTKQHFLRYRRERIRQFIKSAVRELASEMSANGYRRFVLTGEPRAMAEVRKSLTKPLESMLLAAIPYTGEDAAAALAALALPVFRDYEEQESRSMVEKLRRELETGGHGAAGPLATLMAIRRKQAQAVVMAKDCQLGRAWECSACGWLAALESEAAVCPSCRRPLRSIDLKEEIARNAVVTGCEVEIVAEPGALAHIGGVGCLLRYLAAEQWAAKMSA